MLRALSVAPLGTRTSLGSGMAIGVGAARRRRKGARRARRRVVRGRCIFVRLVGGGRGFVRLGFVVVGGLRGCSVGGDVSE